MKERFGKSLLLCFWIFGLTECWEEKTVTGSIGLRVDRDGSGRKINVVDGNKTNLEKDPAADGLLFLET